MMIAARMNANARVCNLPPTTMMLAVVALLCSTVLTVRAAEKCLDVEANKGLQIYTNVVDAPIDWSPRYAGRAGESDLVLLVTQNHTLYRSIDDGKTFNKVRCVALYAPFENRRAESRERKKKKRRGKKKEKIKKS